MLSRAWIGLLVAPVVWMAASDDAEARPGRERAPRPEVGAMVADFELKDVEGKPVKLSSFRDQIFVMELGACT